MSITTGIWKIRRFILKNFVPSFIWPKQVFIDGVSINLREAPYSFGTKWIIKNGSYEAPERKLLSEIIKPGYNIIEMGGSIGIVTAVLGSKTGNSGRVISVEGSDKIVSYSKKWLEAKGNIKIVHGFGFPVFTTKNKIRVQHFDESKGTLGGTLSFEVNETQQVNEEKSNLYDLQRIMTEFNIQPDVLITDIEGTEKIMTTVKPDIPASIKVMVMELHPGLYGEETMYDIIKAIESEGFISSNIEGGVYIFKRS